MTYQEALKIMMKSPIYFRMTIKERMQLIKDYCRMYDEIRKKRPPKNL